MKKIIISLILLLTCQQVFSQANKGPWVKIEEYKGHSEHPRTFVIVDAINCPPSPKHIKLRLRYEYTFRNDVGLTYVETVYYDHTINHTPGDITTHTLFWRRPTEERVHDLENLGYREPRTGPRVRVSIMERNGYNIVEGGGWYEDGREVPEVGFNNIFDDAPDYFTSAMLTFGAYWEALFGDDMGDGYGGEGRNLGVKYGIREDISNHRRPKTKLTFNATMYKGGVSMEHFFILSHKYIYTSTIQPKSFAVTIDTMVQAFIPAGKVVSGTVDYPEVPSNKRLFYFLNFYKLTAIKVTMKTPFLVLGSGNNRDEYSNGPGYNNNDGNKWDDHVNHTWATACDHPSHVSQPYVNGTNGLILNVVRTRVNP
ncbi:MAG: hypothetical protein NTU80_14675 [Verrucomicrobia bacterium]|nr:hypothetical protein [Verrucomicrobiota bacterium]